MSNELATKNEFGIGSVMSDNGLFDRMHRLAEVMASSKMTVPKHLQGNTGDCMAIVMQASQWKMNPFAVAQKTHIVNGNLGYEAQLVAAVINSSGVVSDRFSFDWQGNWDKWDANTTDRNLEKSLTVIVSATIKGESEPRSLLVSMSQATVRNSPLWKSDPKQQLAYLAQKKWARLFAPDVILGVYSADEFDELPQMKELTPDGGFKQSEPVYYPADQFKNNFEKWKSAIQNGKKTPEEVIATVETKGKLTDEQRKQILSVTNIVIDAEPVDEPQQQNEAASPQAADDYDEDNPFN
ncbi:DNA recombination protein RecT [Formosimonas limnophila]|uniref:DNA recombination protein RecT n=1 Tax=Formosimonas limnophila TaxID=1384487 RepID=A0A8J3CLC0_9BURK|nr:RecT family recombinase [Formosimonas limnophila]GHA65941.1 DNA recombination protein RecT [Formosimonas limnophila]